MRPPSWRANGRVMHKTTIITAGLLIAASSWGCGGGGSSNGSSDTDTPDGTDSVSETNPIPSASDSDSETDSVGDSSSGGEPGGLPTTPPTAIELLTEDGFTDASAIDSAPDGSEFYFAAYDDEGQPGIFSVDTDTGLTTALHVGAPLAYPSDVAVSCDGSQIFVSDVGGASAVDPEQSFEDSEEIEGGIFVLSPSGGTPESVSADAVGRAGGLVVSVDCESLFVAGYTLEGAPAVFRMPVDGGAVSVVHEGDPLVAPTGIHSDADDVAWVMDHFAEADSGATGLLFAIDDQGGVSEVVSGLGMGRHGGVSLAPGGITALIPVEDDLKGSRLIAANTENGDVEEISTSDVIAPAGVAAARSAPVVAIASENAIYLATYE